MTSRSAPARHRCRRRRRSRCATRSGRRLGRRRRRVARVPGDRAGRSRATGTERPRGVSVRRRRRARRRAATGRRRYARFGHLLLPLSEDARGSARARPRLVGITYPRDVWWMRAFMRLYNLVHAARRRPARYFVHRHALLERWMTGAGYRNVHEGDPGLARGPLPALGGAS